MTDMVIDREIVEDLLGYLVKHRDRCAAHRGSKAVVASLDADIAKVNAALAENDREQAEAAEEQSLDHFNRYIAGDR